MILELKKIGSLFLLIFLFSCDESNIEKDCLSVDCIAETYLKRRGYDNLIKDNEFNSKISLSAQREVCNDFECAKKDTFPSVKELCGQSRFCSQILLSDYVAYRRYYKKRGEFDVFVIVLIDSVRRLPIGLYNENHLYPDEINSGEHNVKGFDFGIVDGMSISLDSVKNISDSLRKNDDAVIRKMSEEFLKRMSIKDSVVSMDSMQSFFLKNHNSFIAMERSLEKILNYKKESMHLQMFKKENEILFLQNAHHLSNADFYCLSQSTFEKCEKPKKGLSSIELEH